MKFTQICVKTTLETGMLDEQHPSLGLRDSYKKHFEVDKAQDVSHRLTFGPQSLVKWFILFQEITISRY